MSNNMTVDFGSSPDFNDKGDCGTSLQKAIAYNWLREKGLYGTQQEQDHAGILYEEIKRLRAIEAAYDFDEARKRHDTTQS